MIGNVWEISSPSGRFLIGGCSLIVWEERDGMSDLGNLVLGVISDGGLRSLLLILLVLAVACLLAGAVLALLALRAQRKGSRERSALLEDLENEELGGGAGYGRGSAAGNISATR
jgi:hypothetical protein